MSLSRWRLLAVVLALTLLGLLMFVRFAKASPLRSPSTSDRLEKLEYQSRLQDMINDLALKRR